MWTIEDESARIAGIVADSVLAGLPIEEGPGQTLIVDGVDPDLILPSWQAARDVLARTGRWPVLIDPDSLEYDPSEADLAEMRHAATTGDPWSVFRRRHDDGPPPDWRVNSLTALFGDDLDVRAPNLDRRIYDLLLSDPRLAARVVHSLGDYSGTGQWYRPHRVQLALLPTATSWLAPAWVVYHGALDPGRRRALAGAFREWEQRCGAEPVAAWGTMLQFVVARPPAAGDPAWEVAGQLMAVGGSLQMDRWTLALGVARSDAWFLHDRP
jgi:uncharacterized protein DUF4253